MATEVTLPALGESVTEGTVTQWLKSVGDEVAMDEPLLEVSTDKVDTEIPSPAAGTLLEIRADQDETVEVGAVLAVIGEPSEGGDSGSSDSSGSSDQTPDESADDSGDESAQPEPEPRDSDESAEPSADQPSADRPSADQQHAGTAVSEQPQAGTGDAGKGGTDVTLPALGESVTEGTVTQWLKSVGDEVAVDEPLLEVSTDKVDTEIPSPVAGTLTEILVQEDETVEVGAVLARIGSGAAAQGDDDLSAPEQEAQPEQDEPEPEQKKEEQRPETEQQTQPEPTPEPEPEPETEPDRAAQTEPPPHSEGSPQRGRGAEASDEGPAYVTPLVRKLAAKHNVDLQGVQGTGVGGRVRKQDVLAAAEAAEAAKQRQQSQPTAPAQAPAAQKPAAVASGPDLSALRGRTEKLSRLRRVIAARMLESLQTSAQLTTVVEVDVTAIARLRTRVKADFEQREGVKLSFLPFFAKATIDALKTYPQVNASIDTDEGTVTYHDAEHLGVAVDTERGLLVPVIKNAGDLSIAGLARKIADLAARTRDSKVLPDELSGGTFTLTNTGSRGALFDTPIINQPQVGILGTGSVVKRAVVIDDPNLGETIAVREMAYLALTYDHRLVDGADAARFLTAVKQRLEEAGFESELGV